MLAFENNVTSLSDDSRIEITLLTSVKVTSCASIASLQAIFKLLRANITIKITLLDSYSWQIC